MGESDSWCSPQPIADGLEDLFGGPVDLDPCSNHKSIIRAKEAYFRGGLILPWRRTTYANFPYSKADLWVEKGSAELEAGNVRELIYLSQASTTTGWWRDMCEHPRWNPRILFLRRLVFIDPTDQGREYTCRFEPALTYFGPRPTQFTRAFTHVTNWATWGRSTAQPSSSTALITRSKAGRAGSQRRPTTPRGRS